MEKISLKSTNWRDFIPPADCARRLELAQSDTYQWAEHRCAEPFIANWRKTWQRLYEEPYKGITNDGHVMPEVHHMARPGEDCGAPTAQMVAMASKLLSIAGPEQRRAVQIKDVDAPEWRAWMNPEIYISRHGVRLEEASDTFVEAVHDLMRASLSEAGYYKAHGCMKVNHYLGEVLNGEKVLNVCSYNITIFGTPSETEPWGWQIFGHHFSMNCFVRATQMVVTPVFMGAEPNIIEDGPYAGTELFTDQEQTALALINSIANQSESHRESIIDRVRIYKELQGPEYPEWRYHPADQRHLGGAFQDNRTIPYEGVKVTTLSSSQQDLVRRLITLSIDYLPEGALVAKMKEVQAYWAETYFCWIGAFNREDGFYYKVHSPVVMVEFDHHSGVFLNNALPLPFHIHTLVRTPQGNDYGKALLRQYRQAKS
ncbi:hypothetical protein LTR99_006389 [Exophiala xenobiotica]|uniref:DUF3500 domain-containing protein n=1 Tax=Vermiconidia calcicola TaxID=1690605 RepID=A0AAV9QAH5_9PEZI|nr:hypothetical protein LTR96_007237 [Exophiala xenobiotica]KAK5534965.1 hypothetical protein LTR23_008520 [Chaetothyriales sp. CCFEE 6169]KAK5537560.1 hypothetical protein LTR25_004812 [Vermiconidia calcicola]KAK5301422.1 hypothetical protein LTR99_006389 [Exophiala xenobiotica]KAK5334942.1 hypothetical protein LTR98_008662 [Exophiala xenobiotica]